MNKSAWAAVIAGLACGPDHSFIDNGYLPRNRFGIRQIMGGEKNGSAFQINFTKDDLQELILSQRVQTAHRFIQD